MNVLGVSALLGPDLGAHLADGEREVEPAAGGVGYDVCETRHGRVVVTDHVHHAVAGLDAAVLARDRVAGPHIVSNGPSQRGGGDGRGGGLFHDHVAPMHVVNGRPQFNGVHQLLG